MASGEPETKCLEVRQLEGGPVKLMRQPEQNKENGVCLGMAFELQPSYLRAARRRLLNSGQI